LSREIVLPVILSIVILSSFGLIQTAEGIIPLTPGTTWDWQLQDPLTSPRQVSMYDIDLFDNNAQVVTDLHNQGTIAICYISVGSWEDFRPDAGLFPDAVKGEIYDGFPNERWLDINNPLIRPLIEDRFDLCASKGFDGIEPDNIDGYLQNTGFTITYQDQIDYNIWLTEQAHMRGLSIGLKNDFAQIGDLITYFDWALSEECFVNNECALLSPFIASGKAVFQAEYVPGVSSTAQFCPESLNLGLSGLLLNEELDGTVFGPCVPPSCIPPDSGTWTVTSTCTLGQNDEVFGNLMVQNNSVLTIPTGLTLTIDLNTYNITVESGSGVLIESGGTLQINS